MDQTVLHAITHCLPLPRRRSPDDASLDWGCAYLIAAYYFYLPRKDERLSRPGWLTYSGRFTHISGHPSAAGRAQDRESSPVKDRRSTNCATQPTYTHHRHLLLLLSPKVYSFYGPMEGRKLSRPGWLLTNWDGLPAHRRFTHLGTNRVWRSATKLNKANALPLSQPPTKNLRSYNPLLLSLGIFLLKTDTNPFSGSYLIHI